MSFVARNSRRLAAGLVAFLAGAAALTACSPDNPTRTISPAAVVDANDDGYQGTLIDPPLQPADIVLTDTAGNRVELQQRPPNAVTALFFGFTHCDDVCPTIMADLAAAKRSLPPALARRVTIIFVTVDPDRDTPAAINTWLNRFHGNRSDDDIVGLRGPIELVHQAEASLYAAPSEAEPPPPHHTRNDQHTADRGPDYEVSHTGSVYVFGPGGTSLFYSGGTTPLQYADDFTQLLKA